MKKMNNKKEKLLTLLLLSFGIINIKGQEAIIASGADASGSGGSVSYSVGQLFNKTKFGSNGYLSEGTQQPIEILVLTELNSTNAIKLECSAFPNPTTDLLVLKIGEYQTAKNQKFSYQLFDNNGKLLLSDIIGNIESSIQISNFNSTNYILRVKQENKTIKTFKIIKK